MHSVTVMLQVYSTSIWAVICFVLQLVHGHDTKRFWKKTRKRR